jgi:two-component system sensor histidine kinase PilS (NtrC family)
MLDPFKTDLEQSSQMLRRFALARAFIISIVAAYCATLEARSGSPLDLNTVYLFVVIAIALVESILAMAIIAAGHKPDMRFSFFLLCADLIQNSAIILMTGGNESVFVFLYIAIILSASLLYSFRWTLVTATACSLVFLATVVLEFYGYVLPASPFLTETHAAELNLVPDTIMKIFAFYLSAFLGGLLSERVGLLRSFHENIINSLSSGYISINRDGIVTFLNPTGSNLLKRVKTEAVGKDISTVFSVAGGRANPLTEAISKKNQINSREIAVVRGDGKTIPVGITVSPILNGANNLVGAVGSFIDLTELKRMEEKLRRADRLAAVGEMSSALAHEIRNPVASIRGALQELSENMVVETTNRQLMSIAVKECDQLGKIVSDFLEFVFGGDRSHERINIADLLDEVVKVAQQSFFNGSGRIHTNFPSVLGCVTGDRMRLREALLKVIRNGKEAMPDGGILCVSAAVENRESPAVSIVVEDEGKGISHEEFPKLFNPFFTTKPNGTGLGLAIVHKIISSHDGTIDVDSTAGKGTRVKIVLPRQDEEENG